MKFKLAIPVFPCESLDKFNFVAAYVSERIVEAELEYALSLVYANDRHRGLSFRAGTTVLY